MTNQHDNKWHIKEKQKVIFNTPIFNVAVQEMVCPRTQKNGSFYLLEFGDWVNVTALTTDNQFVMIRQFRAGTQKVENEIPGGLIDKEDISPVEAGIRELFEETGYRGENAKIIGVVHPNPAIQWNKCYTILVENAIKISEPEMEESEDIETILVPLKEISQMVSRGEITHGLVLNALFFLDKYLTLQTVHNLQ